MSVYSSVLYNLDTIATKIIHNFTKIINKSSSLDILKNFILLIEMALYVNKVNKIENSL